MICKTCATAADAVKWAADRNFGKSATTTRLRLARRMHAECQGCTCQHRVQ